MTLINTAVVPPGVPAALRVATAAQALNIDARTLMRWCRSGHVKSIQPGGAGGKYWVPALELARVAAELMIEPDWIACL